MCNNTTVCFWAVCAFTCVYVCVGVCVCVCVYVCVCVCTCVCVFCVGQIFASYQIQLRFMLLYIDAPFIKVDGKN